jgi:hypothetical protein
MRRGNRRSHELVDVEESVLELEGRGEVEERSCVVRDRMDDMARTEERCCEGNSETIHISHRGRRGGHLLDGR